MKIEACVRERKISTLGAYVFPQLSTLISSSKVSDHLRPTWFASCPKFASLTRFTKLSYAYLRHVLCRNQQRPSPNFSQSREKFSPNRNLLTGIVLKATLRNVSCHYLIQKHKLEIFSVSSLTHHAIASKLSDKFYGVKGDKLLWTWIDCVVCVKVFLGFIVI